MAFNWFLAELKSGPRWFVHSEWDDLVSALRGALENELGRFYVFRARHSAFHVKEHLSVKRIKARKHVMYCDAKGVVAHYL